MFHLSQLKPDNKSDVNACYKLHKKYQVNPWSEAIFSDMLSTPYTLLVGRFNTRVAGYILLLCVADEITVMDIAVSTEYRRRGLAKALIEKVIKNAEDKNYHAIFLEVRSQNLAARRLYASLSFGIIDTRKGYYPSPSDGLGRDDAIIMKRLIK